MPTFFDTASSVLSCLTLCAVPSAWWNMKDRLWSPAGLYWSVPNNDTGAGAMGGSEVPVAFTV